MKVAFIPNCHLLKAIFRLVPARCSLVLPVIVVLGCTDLGSLIPVQQPVYRVLVYSRTTGFRHASIPAGIAAIQKLGALNGFEVVATEDPLFFDGDNLEPFAVVVFLCTTGDVLNGSQEDHLKEFIRKGRGFVGIHSAADTEYDWSWYGGLMGAYFMSHPAIQEADIIRTDSLHLSTRALPSVWTRTDEWYNFAAHPNPTEVTVLLNLDESSYTGGTMGPNHPIAWYREYDGGRSWYTALGHTTESYGEPDFLRHLGGGILWAAGVARESVMADP